MTASPTAPTLLPGGGGADGELSPGALAGEYVIERRVAVGGCGTVYEAHHRVLGRRVAIKVLHRALAEAPEVVRRFIAEARAVNRIAHPNIIDVHEFGHLEDRRPFSVMPLLEGVTLDELLRLRGRLGPAEVLELMEPLCAALAAAHQAGVVHRDLKASNVHVGAPEGPPRVIVLDFGIAKLLEPDGAVGCTATGARLGTPHTMAPEQILGGAVGPETDVYALGVLLFQLLTGRLPFEAGDAAELERMHLGVAPPRPGVLAPVSPALEAVVLRCLEKSPARRFTGAHALLGALRQAVAAPGPTAIATAVAIYVEGRTRGELDDAAFAALADALEVAESTLAEAGYPAVFASGNALLGARVLPDDPAAARGARADALDVARRLRVRLDALESDRLHVNVAVHADRAALRAGRIASGPLLQLSSWALQEDHAGVFATEAVITGPVVPGERDIERRRVL